jgi:hypothetical protein
MTTSELEQKISVPLRVGDRVTLSKDVDIEDGAMGYTAIPFFEDYVAQYVPATGLLRFEDSDIGRAEFLELLEEAEGIEILTSGED